MTTALGGRREWGAGRGWSAAIDRGGCLPARSSCRFWRWRSFSTTCAIWNETGYLVATTDALPPLPGQEPAYRQMEAGLTNETIWPGPRGLEALSVFNDWMARVVRGQVAVEDGMRDGAAAVAALLP